MSFTISSPDEIFFRQRRLHPSGSNPCSLQTVAGSSKYFAYASTLSVFIYSIETHSLLTIIGGNKSNIVSLLWHPRDDSTLCVSTVEGHLSVWRVDTEGKCTCSHQIKLNMRPTMGCWNASGEFIAFAFEEKKVAIWDYAASDCVSIKSPGGYGVVPTALQWNPKKNTTLLTGWKDGSLILVESNPSLPFKESWSMTTLTSLQLTNRSASVSFVEWDPLSGVYAVVADARGSLALWDVDKEMTVGSVERHVSSLVALRWLPAAPGNFVTFSSKSLLAKVWNVSQPEPVGILRLSGCSGSGGVSGATILSKVKSGSKVFVSFTDGSLALYDAATQRLEWSSLPGHTETIFGLQYSPSNPDVLATCSYDGTTKIWHTPTMDLKLTLGSQGGVIYTVCFSPDGKYIATGSSNGSVWTWDAAYGKSIKRMDLHTRHVYRVSWAGNYLASASADGRCVVFDADGVILRQYRLPSQLFGCDWCPHRERLLACAGTDAIIRVFDTTLHSLNPIVCLKGHSDRIFCVSWSPLLPFHIASGSDDKTVRVWKISGSELDSSSQTTASSSREEVVLRGHTSKVRPLLWSTEIPWLLFSGSWDGTVRAWDVRRSQDKSLATMADHIADVYGIASHPRQPFVIATSSRDTTLRFSSLEGIVSTLRIRTVLQGSLSRCLSSVEASMAEDSSHLALLCGEESRNLAEDIKVLHSSRRSADLYERIFSFFGGPDGLAELWAMFRALEGNARGGNDTSHLDRPAGLDFVSERVTHSKHIISRADDLATRLSGRGVFMHRDERMRKDERLERAAQLHLLTGNLRQYCEICIQRGMWDQALAMAPGVDANYWQELIQRRLDSRRDVEGKGEGNFVLPLLLASGQVSKALDSLIDGDDLHSALIMASAASTGNFSSHSHMIHIQRPSHRRTRSEGKEELTPPGSPLAGSPHHGTKGVTADADRCRGGVEAIAKLRADRFYRDSQPVLAAACLLSISDADGALDILSKSGEPELAFALAQSLNFSLERLEPFVVAMASKAESLKDVPLALSILDEGRQAKCLKQAMIASQAWAANSPETASKIMDDFGLQGPELYKSAAAESSGGTEAVANWLLAGDFARAASHAIDAIRYELQASPRSIDRLQTVQRVAAHVPADRLKPLERNRLLAMTAIGGIVLAMHEGYHAVLTPLYRHVVELRGRLNDSDEKTWAPESGRSLFTLPTSMDIPELGFMCLEHLLSRGDYEEAETFLPELDSPAHPINFKFKEKMSQLKKEVSKGLAFGSKSNHCLEPGAGATASPAVRANQSSSIISAGTLLPTAAGSFVSKDSPLWPSLEGRGAKFILEDGLQSVPYNMALMWSKVDGFSPLGTGEKLQVW